MLPFAAILITATLFTQLFQHSLPASALLHGARVTIFPLVEKNFRVRSDHFFYAPARFATR